MTTYSKHSTNGKEIVIVIERFQEMRPWPVGSIKNLDKSEGTENGGSASFLWFSCSRNFE